LKREAAEKIVEAVKKLDQLFGELDAVSNLIDDDEEKKKLQRAIFTLVIEIHEKITREVVKQFPDLHPDKDEM
jgi:hypothetical protein